jgi:hypothetical protein
MDILKQTLRNEGFFALYKGVFLVLFGAGRMRVFTTHQGWPAYYLELLALILSFLPHTASLNALFHSFPNSP